MRVSAVPSALWPQSAPVASGPSVSRVHGAKLQITHSNCSQNLQSSQVWSLQPSLGLSPSHWPIWRCLSSEALPGASIQDRAQQGAVGKEDNDFNVHLLWMQWPMQCLAQLDCFAPKTRVLISCSTPSPSSAFPRQDVAPEIAPNQQIPANLLHTGAAWRCWTPGTSQRSCACPTELWLSLRASLLFWWRVLFHCCLPSSQGSKF